MFLICIADDGTVVVKVDEAIVRANGVSRRRESVMDHDEHVLQMATDRFERRLAEESGKLRVDIADVRTAVSSLRAEMIDRNHELLKWALIFWATQIAAVAALMALFK